MPRVARVFIKIGLLYFLCALLLGIAYEINSISFPGMMPLFWHLLTVGWITQIIFGVSLWMFPGRIRKEGFMAQKWAWITYGLLNAGLGFRLIVEPVVSSSDWVVWDILIVLSGILQATAAVTYTIELWPRVQSKEQRRRQRQKNR